jgi:IS5 family transposase
MRSRGRTIPGKKQANLGPELTTKKTRKREFLDEMNRVVPWSQLVALIEPHSPRAKTDRPPFPIETMLRIHFLQQWFSLSDLAMEEALFDVPLFREFAQLPEGMVRLPDESTILGFCHLLEKHGLAAQMFAAVNATLGAKGQMLETGSVIDATLIAAPSSTKNSTGTRDPEMHQTRKGNNWYFGIKAHIAVDADSSLVHHQVCTAANVHDLNVVDQLLYGREKDVFADSGYRGIGKRSRRKRIRWSVAMTPGKRKALDPDHPIDALRDKLERIKASIRAKVEHPFRIIKRQFGYTKARYRGLAKNGAQVTTLFLLSNLWMMRGKLVGAV